MKTTLKCSAAVTALSLTLLPTVANAQYQERDDLIIVTGSPLPRTTEDLTLGASIVEGEALARVQSTTIGEALRTEPGISSTFFGAGASRPIIRGQGGDRIRVLDNGIGTIDAAASSPDHAVAVEPAMAERIEIVRGTGLLRYGSSAAGGVVNVIDGRIPSETPEDGIDGAFRVGGSTVDDGADAAGGITAKIGEVSGIDILIHASGTWREAEDYDIPGFAESALFRAMEEEEEHEEEDEDHDHEDEEEAFGTLENSFINSQSVAGGLSFVGSKGFLGVSIKNFEIDYGIPGGHEHAHGEEDHDEDEEDHDDEDHDHEEEEEEGGVFIVLDQTRIDLNGRYELGGGLFEAVSVFAGYADYQHVEIEPSGEEGTVFTNEGWEVRAELLQAERSGWRGATGVQYRQREFVADGLEAFVPATETDQIGLFTFQEIRRGAWLFEGALRYENTQHTNSDARIEREFNGVSVSAGTNYDLTDSISLAGNVFRTERAPTIEELYSNGPHLATGQFELGDVNLDEEVATGLEAILHLHSERGFVTVSGFYTDYQDYIYEANTGAIDEHEELPIFAFTAEDATFAGFEIEAEALVGTVGPVEVTADGVFDFVDADLESGGNLPRIPPIGATVGLEGATNWASLRAEVEYAGEQDDTAAFELPTDSYTLVNTYLSVSPFPSAPGVTLRLAGLNLTDEDARQHTSFLKDEVPLPGRNWRLSLETRF